MNKHIRFHLTLFAIIIAVFICLFYYCNSDTVLLSLKYHSIFLSNFIKSNYTIASTIYVIILAFITFLGIPLGIISTMAGGYFFGVFAGTLYTLIGSTMGAVCTFLTTRYIFQKTLYCYYNQNLTTLFHKITQKGSLYLAALHFLHIPFFLINTVAALTPMPLIKFTLTTLLAHAPSVCINVFIGCQLDTVSCVRDLFTPTIITLLIILALIAIIPLTIEYTMLKKRSSLNLKMP